jgi:hypothetical protein
MLKKNYFVEFRVNDYNYPTFYASPLLFALHFDNPVPDITTFAFVCIISYRYEYAYIILRPAKVLLKGAF